MRLRFLFCLPSLLCATQLAGFGQSLPASVRVVAARTQQPIPYASVGVPGKPLGTVADAQGRFQPAQTGAAPTDTLVVSCVGYQPRRVLMQQLTPVLRLTPQTQQLGGVVVHGTQPRPVILGHRGVSSFTSYGFYTQTDTVPHARLGREFGMLLHIKRPTQVQELRMFTFGPDFKQVTFRLNVYTVRNGQPQESLLTKDVLFTINSGHRHWTTIDLRPYSIELTGPQEVVATVQWVDSEQSRGGGRFFNIPAHLSATHTSFMRDKSAQTWRKFSVNPSMYFTGLQDETSK